MSISPSDDVIRSVYATVMSKALAIEDFDPYSAYFYKEAWKAVAKEWNVIDIEDNGFGRIIRGTHARQ